jgi:hypothetical protein
MKSTTIIEIDVGPLYRDLGVHLSESTIAPGCISALRKRLERVITRQMLLEAMLEASKPPKRQRQKKLAAAAAGTSQEVPS